MRALRLPKLSINVASKEVSGCNGYDCRWDERTDCHRGERCASEPGSKTMQHQLRHSKIAVDLPKSVLELWQLVYPCRDRHESDEGDQPEHEGIGRQHYRVSTDGMRAARAQNCGDSM